MERTAEPEVGPEVGPEVNLDLARAVLAAQPFSEHVGARITEFGDGAATLEIDVVDHHRQQFGLVHGGVWCYAADNALTFAAGTVLGPSVVTASVSVDYLRGARDGTLVARATVTAHDGDEARCDADLHVVAPDGTRTLCARATGVVRRTRGPRPTSQD